MEAPVLCRFAVSQLSSGGMLAKEKDTATQSSPYRALKACEGKAPDRIANEFQLNLRLAKGGD